MSENDIPRPQAEAVRALRADRDFLRGRVAHGLVGCAGAFVCLRAVETLPAWVTLLTCAAALVALLVLGTLWEYEWGPRIARRWRWLRWSAASDWGAAAAFPAGGLAGIVLWVVLWLAV